MTVDPQLMELIETFGPIFLAAVGSVLSVVFGAFMWIGAYVWRQHKRRMELMARSLGDLAKGIKAADDANRDEHGKVWSAIQGLRAELQLANRNTEGVKAGLLKAEGALDNHRATLYEHIQQLVRMDSKFEAVFRFLDAPRRATD